MPYERPPFDELAADQRIKKIASNMMAGNNDPRELREAWGLMAAKAEGLYSPDPRSDEIAKRVEADKTGRFHARREAFEHAAQSPQEAGIAGRVAATIKRTLGFGS